MKIRNILATIICFSALILSANAESLLENYLDTTLENTKQAQYKTMFKKGMSTICQALLMGAALNGDDDKPSLSFDYLWNQYIIESLNNPKNITNGVILADGTSITYSKTGRPCTNAPENPKQASKNTACAVLMLDSNGQNAPNQFSSFEKINDRFLILLYRDKALPFPNSIEEKLLTRTSR